MIVQQTDPHPFGRLLFQNLCQFGPGLVIPEYIELKAYQFPRVPDRIENDTERFPVLPEQGDPVAAGEPAAGNLLQRRYRKAG
jgi:hypothetical protein